MKTSIVPAQVTSVEDKIAGSLTFPQLLLMIVPVFVSAALFVFLPPFTAFKIYKLIVASVIAIISITLSVRVRGRIILHWISILGRYNLRPRYYTYDKNTTVGRKISRTKVSKRSAPESSAVKKPAKPVQLPRLRVSEELAFEAATGHPAAEFHFKRNKKGSLNVHIKEVG